MSRRPVPLEDAVAVEYLAWCERQPAAAQHPPTPPCSTPLDRQPRHGDPRGDRGLVGAARRPAGRRREEGVEPSQRPRDGAGLLHLVPDVGVPRRQPIGEAAGADPGQGETPAGDAPGVRPDPEPHRRPARPLGRAAPRRSARHLGRPSGLRGRRSGLAGHRRRDPQGLGDRQGRQDPRGQLCRLGYSRSLGPPLEEGNVVTGRPQGWASTTLGHYVNAAIRDAGVPAGVRFHKASDTGTARSAISASRTRARSPT
ncbi:hypothetical protein [Nocardioides convexus]|uniref:hypothetical protein n=1 Tax=Nocardioides convexus TaxID=2712224 RepID=UPI00241845F0|nr:hypothetical protein [Nocardioides convexus]